MNLFKAFTPVTDTEEQLRLHILWLIFIRVVLLTLLLGITALLQSERQRIILPPHFFSLIFIFTFYSYSIGSALILQKKKLHLRRFALIQLLSDTFFIALLVYATGCSQSIFTPVFFLPILAGGLILYRIGGLIPAAAATILYGTVLTGEFLGYIPPYFFATRYRPVKDFLVSTDIFAVYGLTFFLIALLSGMLARRLRFTEDALSLTVEKYDRLSLLYKQIFEDIMTGIITVDDDDNITSCNPAAESITGYHAAEITGRPLNRYFPEISVEQAESRRVADLKKKDGTLIRVGYSCSGLHPAPDITLGSTACTRCKVVTMQDISKIEQMEKQVREAEKMAAVGELSASIAHDFRNPLAAISGSAQILALDFADQAGDEARTQHRLTDIILRESDKMARAITDFLHYARPDRLQYQWFNLRRLAEETVEGVIADGGRHPGCSISIEVPATLDVCADRQQIQIALAHLLKNSCYASRDTTEPVIISGREESREGRDGVELKVIDRGTGIAPEIRDRLFAPFTTTRADATGLGLAVVQQIVISHGGSIDVESREGRGCTVRIHLPLPSPGSTP
ncbi:MAG: PAS domain S-box protein [Deltaproteobacteria bacterium]|nr:PAS domain S-box protein [Deltaproteobacteria bacterium]